MGTHQIVNTTFIQVLSFNLHGFNQGFFTVRDLLLTKTPHTFCLQELWLTPDNMNKLDNVCDNYIAVGSSAMVAAVSAGIMNGRPFGGFLSNKKSIHDRLNIVTCAECFCFIRIAKWLFINIYTCLVIEQSIET